MESVEKVTSVEKVAPKVQSLGKLIGVVNHTFSITNDNKDKVQLSIDIDFTGASDQDIKGWLVSNRIIAGQRPWRKLDRDELEGMKDGVFISQNIGQKVKGRSEKVRDLINVGIPEDLAGFAVDNPVEFKKVMQGMKKE